MTQDLKQKQSRTQSLPKAQTGPGRPRGFDEAEALGQALQVFWKQGYEATSIDDLTAAMRLSRSSFYSAFSSKQDVFVAALRAYSENALGTLEQLAQGEREEALEAMVLALSGASDGPKGCMLVNCITELAPHNEQVAEIGRQHLERIEDLFARVLSPQDPGAANSTASALSALAIGILTLRKSGVSAHRIEQALSTARTLFTT
ncbi:MAG: TetR/AcrR family transcriptional regulator [Rhodobacteraceae bacterium]|nr:TetR/AcrR family transcriptional regulator [Paracoccaceae bacterium]